MEGDHNGKDWESMSIFKFNVSFRGLRGFRGFRGFRGLRGLRGFRGLRA